jgi:hypothetical protein
LKFLVLRITIETSRATEAFLETIELQSQYSAMEVIVSSTSTFVISICQILKKFVEIMCSSLQAIEYLFSRNEEPQAYSLGRILNSEMVISYEPPSNPSLLGDQEETKSSQFPKGIKFPREIVHFILSRKQLSLFKSDSSQGNALNPKIEQHSILGFDALPDDVVNHVLTFLPPWQVLKLSGCSKRFLSSFSRKLVECPDSWKHFSIQSESPVLFFEVSRRYGKLLAKTLSCENRSIMFEILLIASFMPNVETIGNVNQIVFKHQGFETKIQVSPTQRFGCERRLSRDRSNWIFRLQSDHPNSDRVEVSIL